MKNSKCFALLVAMSLLILSACNSRFVYDRYASTPISEIGRASCRERV